MRTPRIFRIPPRLWRELRLDEQEMYDRVLCGLYLGYGVLELKRIVALRPDDIDVTELLRVAPLMGLSAEDRLVKKEEA